MPKCPNCGLKAEITRDWACRWCGYPLISRYSTKERTKREAEETKKTREETERARKEAEEAEKHATKEALKLAKEKVKREAEEAKKAKEEAERARKEAEEAEKQAAKEALKLAKEKTKREAEETKKAGEEIGAETYYEKEVKLVLPSLVSFERLRQLEKHIERVENLKIVWTAGSEDEGEIIAVLLQKPLNLIAILSEMPMVQEVHKKGETIVVMLKTPVGNSEDY